ncbi:aldo/keto reductase [Amanita rubescens]|nr:aldo/keto reductase [Amanita rubescens]
MKVPSFQLRDGTTIPAVGLGCWMGDVGGGARVYEMCTKGLKLGYRHFDTVSNEEMVGKAIRDSGMPRSSIYITTKLARVREAFEQSLRDLDCEYIDLYLMHWPQAGSYSIPSEGYPELINVWKEMEKLLDTGKVKSIGVSNFSIKTLSALLPHCKVVPVINQIEMHPCLPQEDLKSFCEEKGILLTAYSPLGQTSTFFYESPIIGRIADKHRVTPAQVVLSWSVQRGTILIHLPEEDTSAINDLHRQPDTHKSLIALHQPDGTVFGWTYDQLGWNMRVGGVVPQ